MSASPGRDAIIKELMRRRQDPLVSISYRAWVKNGPARRRREEMRLTLREFAARGSIGGGKSALSPKSCSNIETAQAGMSVTIQGLVGYALLAGIPVEGFVMDYFRWLMNDPRWLELTEAVKEGYYEHVRTVPKGKPG